MYPILGREFTFKLSILDTFTQTRCRLLRLLVREGLVFWVFVPAWCVPRTWRVNAIGGVISSVISSVGACAQPWAHWALQRRVVVKLLKMGTVHFGLLLLFFIIIIFFYHYYYFFLFL